MPATDAVLQHVHKSTPPPPPPDDQPQWFAMRDLKRWNAKLPAYKMLEESGIECFTPMITRIVKPRRRGARPERTQIPFMQSLLFVRESRVNLDPIVERTPTLQYRFKRGVYDTPLTVRDADMQNFINAVRSTPAPQYFRPEEITSAMRKRPVRIIGGSLDGYTGTLVTTRGSKTRRLLVEVPGIIAATVEVEPEFIQLI